MDDATREALEGSIKKWQAIVNGTGLDHGTINCALCSMFNNDETSYEDTDCLDCPVAIKAKETGCSNTPYSKWSELHRVKGEPSLLQGHRADTPERIEAARAELAFLESLRETD